MAILCFFLYWGPTIPHKKLQGIFMRNEDVMVVFVIYRVDITYPPSYEGG